MKLYSRKLNLGINIRGYKQQDKGTIVLIPEICLLWTNTGQKKGVYFTVTFVRWTFHISVYSIIAWILTVQNNKGASIDNVVFFNSETKPTEGYKY